MDDEHLGRIWVSVLSLFVKRERVRERREERERERERERETRAYYGFSSKNDRNIVRSLRHCDNCTLPRHPASSYIDRAVGLWN